MKSPDAYRGREQTYLKHFVLERYLERVAYNIGSFRDEFVYVDGFSGPWRSEDEDFDDTSFMIAINKLREVRQGIEQTGRKFGLHCIFVEENPVSFESLKRAVGNIQDVNIRVCRSAFEDAIPEIVQFVGDRFCLAFIDPTGWTGMRLKRIKPLIAHQPGEVLVNFMWDHINRFLEQENCCCSFEELVDGPGLEEALRSPEGREEGVMALYKERLRDRAGFKYVGSTAIRKPEAKRTYFHLVYATRHHKGMVEFRNAERDAASEQEQLDLSAAWRKLTEAPQALLFGRDETLGSEQCQFQNEQRERLEATRVRLLELLEQGPGKYSEVLGRLLETRLVCEQDVKEIVVAAKTTGLITIHGWMARQRVPKPQNTLSLARKV